MEQETEPISSDKTESLEQKLNDDQYFVNKRGQKIFRRCWIPKDNSFKAILFFVHGLGEHCSRYDRFALAANEKGIAVFSIDHIGHGKSEGHRVYIQKFQYYVDDFLMYIECVRSQVGESFPYFLMGHSMGGTIAMRVGQQSTIFKGVILSAPAIIPGDDITSIKIFGAKVLNYFAPKAIISSLDDNSISRDEKEVQTYATDPLVDHKGPTAALAVALLNEFSLITKTLNEIKFPFFLFHGTEDRLANIKGSRKLYDESSSTDKEFKEYKDCYHELLNEIPEMREEATKDIFTWIEKRLF